MRQIEAFLTVAAEDIVKTLNFQVMAAVPLMRFLGLKVCQVGQCSERVNQFLACYQFFPSQGSQGHLLSKCSVD